MHSTAKIRTLHSHLSGPEQFGIVCGVTSIQSLKDAMGGGCNLYVVWANVRVENCVLSRMQLCNEGLFLPPSQIVKNIEF